jgi:hypothetical protein
MRPYLQTEYSTNISISGDSTVFGFRWLIQVDEDIATGSEQSPSGHTAFVAVAWVEATAEDIEWHGTLNPYNNLFKWKHFNSTQTKKHPQTSINQSNERKTQKTSLKI